MGCVPNLTKLNVEQVEARGYHLTNMYSPIRKYATGLIAFFMSGAAAFCQSDSLVLSSAVTAPGGTVSLNLTLTSASDSQPAGIEWTFAYSPSDIVSITTTAGAAAIAANKSLSCAGSRGSHICFLTGLTSSGLKTNVIENGVVAVVTVTVSAATTINVTNALSASIGGKAIATTATGGTVTTVPLSLTSLSCNPGTVASGASTTCTVGLNEPASSGATVTLSDNNALLTIPASVTVPAGATFANFIVSAGDFPTNQSATITAALNGSLRTTTLTLVAPTLVSALSCNPTSLGPSGVSTCTVTLTQPAPAGGSAVTLTSNNTSLTVPASVTVTAGATTAPFSAAAAATIPSNRSATVTAVLGSSAQTASINLVGPIKFIQSTSTAQTGGQTASKAFPGSVTAGDLIIVGLIVDVGAPVSVADLRGTTFSLAALQPVASDHAADVFVGIAGSSGADTITVNAASGRNVYELSIHEYRGVTTAVDAYAGAQGSGTAPASGSLTTVTPNDLVFAWFTNGSEYLNENFSALNAAYTKREMSGSGTAQCHGYANCVESGDLVAATPLTTNATATLNVSDIWSATVIAFKGASSTPADGTPQSVTVTSISQPVSSLACISTSVSSGASTTCTVTLNQPSASGTVVALSSNNSSLTVPASVSVPAGTTSATFAASAAAVTKGQSASITASFNTGGAERSTTTVALNLKPAALSTLSCNPTNLNGGSTSICTITLTSPAPAGGVAVAVSGDHPALSMPSSVSIPASASTAAFAVTAATGPVSGQSTAAVTGSLYGGSQSASLTLTICPCTVLSPSAEPTNPDSHDNRAIEVGMQFASNISGYITGLRLFKAPNNTGTHVGHLWSLKGKLLATVTFTNETASGWQLAYFPSPVAIVAKTPYVISYNAPNGNYAADNGLFTSALSNPPLLGLADGENGPNGVYRYGSGGLPTTGAAATNFWVDPVFNTSATIGTASPASLWTREEVPNTPAARTSQAAQLGLTFASSVPGYITGLRFYKSSANLGQHRGYLWTSTGTLLASVTFTNEAASGWQQANFATPIAIEANTPYVVSYWSPEGQYADDARYFATSGITNEMLYAPADGQYGPNGSFASNNAFPTSSSSSSNYWVDVVFSTALQ